MATKTQKRVSFKEPEPLPIVVENDSINLPMSTEEIVKKHTLDSDEEDVDNDTDNRLADDDIEGQEEATIEEDDGIKITPFNMNDELEEGYFDASGTYIFQDEKEIHDNWLDNVDWVKVKKGMPAAQSDSDSEDFIDTFSLEEKSKILLSIAGYLNSSESVLEAIRRLGGGKNKALSASQKLKLKKLGKLTEQDTEAAENRAKMLELSELADKLISLGDMDAYQLTNERISSLTQKSAAPELDMFADADDGPSASKKMKLEDIPDEISWFYKDKQESVEIHGPFSTEQMLAWSESSWPGDHSVVFAAKGSKTNEFYSTSRIDFELYL